MIGIVRAALAAGVVLAAALGAAVADDGDPAGWSVAIDRRGRAFLKYVAVANGPRLFVVGCLRDVDSLFVGSTGVAGPSAAASGIVLSLTAAGATFRLDGEIRADDAGRPAFEADRDADRPAAEALLAPLLTVLKSAGPARLAIAGGTPVELPLTGAAVPAKRFETVCFGRK